MLTISPLRVAFIPLLSFVFFHSCSGPKTDVPKDDSGTFREYDTDIKYASGYSMYETNEGKWLEVTKPWRGSKDTIRYLIPHSDRVAPRIETAHVLPQSVQSIVCLSTTHLGFIKALGLDTLVVGLSGARWIHNDVLKKRIQAGQIQDVGKSDQLNYELIVALQPDVVFSFGIDGSSLNSLNKLRELGITTVVIAEYMENDPLGKAEWIKFFGSVLHQEQKATVIFDSVESRYLNVVKRVSGVDQKPLVFSGLPWEGAWFVPGGQSFQAKLMADAGAHYLWKDNDEISGTVLDAEVVFSEAIDAEYWLNVSNYLSREDLIALDKRYAHFKAIRSMNVYNNNKRLTPEMGNDYWESAVMEPDVVLLDLVKIFHPQLAESHEFYYYHQLP